jgi:hypothetical protein
MFPDEQIFQFTDLLSLNDHLCSDQVTQKKACFRVFIEKGIHGAPRFTGE